MKTPTFIEENNSLLDSFNGKEELDKMDTHRLRLRLRETTERLKAVVDQAEAQFKAGDRHATFNKQTIEKLNEPLWTGKPNKS